MALNIKNPEVEHLADEISRMTNTSKTETIRQALLELKARVSAMSPDSNREMLLRRFLEHRIWPGIPASASRRWSKEEEEAALGYGESGEPV
jgi:hypothetical protein